MPPAAGLTAAAAARVVDSRSVTNRIAQYQITRSRHDAPASESPKHTRWRVVPDFQVQRTSNSPHTRPAADRRWHTAGTGGCTRRAVTSFGKLQHGRPHHRHLPGLRKETGRPAYGSRQTHQVPGMCGGRSRTRCVSHTAKEETQAHRSTVKAAGTATSNGAKAPQTRVTPGGR